MDNNTVVVIYCSEDGDHSIKQMEKHVFLKQLKDDHKDTIRGPQFFDIEYDRMPMDLNMFTGYIVIDGKIVKPKAIKVESEWIL